MCGSIEKVFRQLSLDDSAEVGDSTWDFVPLGLGTIFQDPLREYKGHMIRSIFRETFRATTLRGASLNPLIKGMALVIGLRWHSF